MLKHETYELWAEGFATSIGVAQGIKYVDIENGATPLVYGKFTKELGVNKKILKTIEDGKYQELQREMYKIGNSDKRLGEKEIVKRAFDKIYGKEKLNAAPREVLKGSKNEPMENPSDTIG